MKKLLLILCLTLCLTSSASAALDLSEWLKELPMSQGVAYSVKDSEFNHVTSAVLMSRGEFGFEAGYIDNGKILASISYKLLDMKEYVDIPIVKELFLRPGLYVGFDEIDTGDPKVDYGISFTMLSVKF